MNFHTGNRDMIEMEKDNLEREAEKTEEFLHLLACAKQQESVDSEREELELIRQKLLVMQKKEEELEPERNALGKRLRNYYQYKLQENNLLTEDNRENQKKVTGQISELQRKSAELEAQIRKAAGEEGGLKTKVQIYDRQEEAFHTRYKEELVRNILGEYEPGTLEILRTTYDQQMEETVRERVRKKKQQETGQENLRRLERTLEDIRADLIRSRMEREKQEEVSKTYEE